MEKEHGDWLKSLGDRDLGLLPIGKTTPETDDDEEEDDEEEVSSFATILIQPKPCTYLSNFSYFSLSIIFFKYPASYSSSLQASAREKETSARVHFSPGCLELRPLR